MAQRISIRKLLDAIWSLPGDEPIYSRSTWYITQKQHWIGWLGEYHGPGAYGRASNEPRDAEYAYNHVVNYKMLLWLASASGVEGAVVAAARRAASKARTMQAKSAAIRRIVPWAIIAEALWG